MNIFEGEQNFIDLMKDVKNGDIIRIISAHKTYDANVLNVTQSQIGIEMAEVKYILIPNSLDGSELISWRLSDGKKYKAVIKDVSEISIVRGGSVINTINPVKKSADSGEPEEETDKSELYKDTYQDILNELKDVDVNTKITIKTGTLLDDDSIDESSITIFELDVIKTYEGDDIIKVLLTNIHGPNNQLESLKNNYLKMSTTQSLILDKSGVKMELKVVGDVKKNVYIENIFDVVLGVNSNKKEEATLDDLLADKRFRDLYYKEPTLFGQLLGKGPVGLSQIDSLLRKNGVNTSYNTKNNKVRFKFNGREYNTGIVNLKNNDNYIGRYTNADTIKLSNPNKRNIYLTIKLVKAVQKNMYAIQIYKNTIKNAQEVSDKIGDGVITILDNNVK